MKLIPAIDIVFMFSGQGSQYYQMGRELFDNDPVFRHSMTQLDAQVKRISGQSVTEILYHPHRLKGEEFYGPLAGAAIFMVEYALAQSLIEAGLRPAYSLGTSMGTYAAAAVAGMMDVNDALATIVGQAAIFARHCRPGGMLAVLADVNGCRKLCVAYDCEIAAINSAQHFVLAGRASQLALLEKHFREHEIAVQRLPVSYAFHSHEIDPARTDFIAALSTVRFGTGTLPLVCCAQAKVVPSVSAESFWQVTRSPIRYRETVARLDQDAPRRYVDLGPTGTLAALLTRGNGLRSESAVHTIMNPFGRELHNRRLTLEIL